MVSDEKLQEVVNYHYHSGFDKTKVDLGLSEESLKRYLREAKFRGIENNVEDGRVPRVLVLDIETAPLTSLTWGLWKQNINIDQILSEWFMLTWSAKWLFDDKVYSDKLTGQEALDENDKRICESIWEFMDYADIIIAHNGDGFDLPRLNTRFLLNGLNPPSPYQSIDTLKVAKKVFAFSSNKLDFIAREFGMEGKMDVGGINTWKAITRKGDETLLALMEEYNKKDVQVLEEVYVKLRPWVRSHPNLSLYYDNIETRCPNCGSVNLQWEADKYYVTPMNKYSAVRCGDCGAIGRSRATALTKKDRGNLISTVAR